MAKKPNKDPYAADAETSALLRYGPETSVLAQLLRDAEDRRDLATRQAVSGRQYNVGAVDRALPAVGRAYAGAQSAIQPAFAQQGGVESAALRARMGESMAQATSQLEARRVSAFEGENASKAQALRDFSSDRAKIGQRAVDLSQERGAFVTQQIGDARSAAAQALQDRLELGARLTQDERASIRSAGQDPDQPLPGGGYAPIAGGRLDPDAPQNQPKPNKGKGWVSDTQQAAASAAIGEAQSWAAEQAKAKVPRRDAEQALAIGQKPQPLYRTVVVARDPVTKKPTKTAQERVLNDDGTQAMTPGIPKGKSKLLVRAALDMAYDGHLSRRTQDLLHSNKIQLKPLGLVTFNEWLKTPEGKAWRREERKRQRQQRSRNTPGPADYLNRPGGGDGTGGGGT